MAKARVGVEAVRPEHPLAALLPCDNVFAESRWYRGNPLVIRGRARCGTGGDSVGYQPRRSCYDKGRIH